MEDRLNKIEELLKSIDCRLNKLANKPTPEHEIFKIGTLAVISKYINDHYNRSEYGKVATATFNSEIVDVLKKEDLTIDVKNISVLMTYVFGINRIKSSGDWYYTGISPK